jgi:hypothetical protein
MTDDETRQKELEDSYAALVCLMGTAIVAVVASVDGKKAYPELIRLLGQIPR